MNFFLSLIGIYCFALAVLQAAALISSTPKKHVRFGGSIGRSALWISHPLFLATSALCFKMGSMP